VLTLGGVNGDERVRDVALLRDECYATGASRLAETVQCDRGAHDDCSQSAAIRGISIGSYIVVRLTPYLFPDEGTSCLGISLVISLM
jgi:hypothetical protein